MESAVESLLKQRNNQTSNINRRISICFQRNFTTIECSKVHEQVLLNKIIKNYEVFPVLKEHGNKELFGNVTAPLSNPQEEFKDERYLFCTLERKRCIYSKDLDYNGILFEFDKLHGLLVQATHKLIFTVEDFESVNGVTDNLDPAPCMKYNECMYTEILEDLQNYTRQSLKTIRKRKLGSEIRGNAKLTICDTDGICKSMQFTNGLFKIINLDNKMHSFILNKNDVTNIQSVYNAILKNGRPYNFIISCNPIYGCLYSHDNDISRPQIRRLEAIRNKIWSLYDSILQSDGSTSFDSSELIVDCLFKEKAKHFFSSFSSDGDNQMITKQLHSRKEQALKVMGLNAFPKLLQKKPEKVQNAVFPTPSTKMNHTILEHVINKYPANKLKATQPTVNQDKQRKPSSNIEQNSFKDSSFTFLAGILGCIFGVVICFLIMTSPTIILYFKRRNRGNYIRPATQMN